MKDAANDCRSGGINSKVDRGGATLYSVVFDREPEVAPGQVPRGICAADETIGCEGRSSRGRFSVNERSKRDRPFKLTPRNVQDSAI